MKDKLETKEFKVLAPFKVKAEGEDNAEVIIIEGIANFQGEMDAEGNGCFVDLSRETVVTSGIKLDVYKNNPQILWQHNRNYTIGKALSVTKKSDGLYIKCELHKEAMDEKDFYRVKSGLVSFFSIGFRCLKVTEKEIKGKPVWFIEESQLFECSVVSLPCNTESSFSQVVKSYEDGSFRAGELVDFSKSNENNIQTQKSDKSEAQTMKLKVADKFSKDEISKMLKLGLISDAEAEVEVDIKEYIDLLVIEKADMSAGSKMRGMVKEVCREVVNEMMDEMTAAKQADELKIKEAAEFKIQEELAAKLNITVDELKELSIEDIEAKVKALEGKSEEELSDEELKALEAFLKDDAVTSLKSLIEE